MKNKFTVKKCVCGRKVEVSVDYEGYEIECTRCGKRSGHYPKAKYAVMEWNREKDILDMVGRTGEHDVIIG